MPWIQHVGVAGKKLVTQLQYDEVWQPTGWTVTTAPPGEDDNPVATTITYNPGGWQANTPYPKGTALLSPGGGLLVAYQDLTTDSTFSETGFDRLTHEGAGAITEIDGGTP